MGKPARKVSVSIPEGQGLQSILVGEIIEISGDGVAILEVPGIARPVAAKTVVQFNNDSGTAESLVGQQVVVIIQEQPAQDVIILGLVNDAIMINGCADVRSDEISTKSTKTVKGQRVEIEARDELQLKCGKSTIVLRSDGAVIVKGENISSRAKRHNKLKGAQISIN